MTRATPQYRQVADTLRRRIQNGVYREGELIPSAADLERDFGVSNITIRKALAILGGEGWTSGRRGVGTVVTQAPPDHRVAIAVTGDFRDWVDTAGARGLPIAQEVLEAGTGPVPPRVARAFGEDDGVRLWRMRRIRRVDGAPISYHVNYARPSVAGRVGRRTMAGNRNFVDVLRDECGVALASMDETVEATVADCDLAALLECDFGDPLFFIENAYRDAAGAVVAITHLYLRGERYLYRASIRLGDGEGTSR